MGITRTVGSGRDHSTIQAAIDYFNGYDFSSNGGGPCYIDVYAEGGGTNGEWTHTAALTGPTGTTNASASNYLVLRAAPGSSFKDHANKLTNALRYNPANGVAINNTQTNDLITIGVNHMHIEGLQLRCSSGAATVVITTIGGGVVTNTTVNNCIIRGNGAAAIANLSFGAHKWVNNVVYGGFLNLSANGGTNDIVCGNTVYFTGDSSNKGAIRIEWGAAVVVDNIAYTDGTNDDIYYPNSGANDTGAGYNAVNDTSGPATGAVTGLTMSNLFESLTGGSEDFRLKATCPSSVTRGGTRRQSDTNDQDIVLTSRDTTQPSIGAWESGTGQAQAPRSAVISMLMNGR